VIKLIMTATVPDTISASFTGALDYAMYGVRVRVDAWMRGCVSVELKNDDVGG
jgi:hypothetical protein